MSDLRWLERFLEAIQAERDAARNTTLSYARDLTDFSGFLAGRGLDLSTADRADVEAYLVDQSDRGMAQATRVSPRPPAASARRSCALPAPARPAAA